MNNEAKLKVVLFALTGCGNAVLDALLGDARVKVEAVFTVKYDDPFPYYAERQLIEVCAERGIVCHHGIKVGSDDGLALLRSYAPDLILMATFKQIIKGNVIGLPRLGMINFHPSLLPKYRGPCPTNAVLLNDEKVTGVTVHYVTEQVDEGNILLQRSTPIEESDNDGRLRKKLAGLSAEMVPEVIGLFAGYTHPTGIAQDHALATSAPKPAVENGYLERVADVNTIRNRIRAFNPLPGTSCLIGGRRIAVDNFELIQSDGPDGVYEQGDGINVVLNSQAIRLIRKL